jgi:phosphoesterase RecJ-like protein
MQPINAFFPLLNTPSKVIITMHQKPDGDAMGSTLGLYHFLKALGHDAVVISPTNWADFLDWMPGINTVIDFEKKREAALALINDADYLFCLDFNTLSRTKHMEQPLANAKGARILIDHHQQPQTEVFAYGVSDTSKSSTCEMVYDIIMGSENGAHISLDVATCLYTGLMLSLIHI